MINAECLLENTGDLAYMGEPLIIVKGSPILDVGKGPGSVSDVIFINHWGLFEQIKSMFISRLNSKYVFKYLFDDGKKLSLAECFERNKIALLSLFSYSKFYFSQYFANQKLAFYYKKEIK